MGELVEALHDRSFAPLMVIFAAPNVLLFILGSSIFTGLPLIVIAWQLICGRSAVWLPAFLSERGISHVTFSRLVAKSMPWVLRVERLARPRHWPAYLVAERLAGCAALFMAVFMFLPVSSTGHVILLVDGLGIETPPGRVFEVAIQSGAIAAVVVVYFQRLASVFLDLRRDPAARAFLRAVILTTLPAVLIGALAHDHIKTLLFHGEVVAWALIGGGIAILVAERLRPAPRLFAIEQFPARTALLIGLAQCLALIPGVSRSAATVLGAMMLGVDRKTAAEFSFFAAIPVLFGATLFDLVDAAPTLRSEDVSLIAIGGLFAFVAAMLVIRPFVAIVGRYGFAPFAWYRIALGSLVLAL